MRWRRASNDEEHRAAPLRRDRRRRSSPKRRRSPPSTTRSCSRWPRKATKPQIKEAIEKLFDVKVKSVNTLVRKGKTKVFRGNLGSQSNTKRAIVTLEEGHRIDVTTGL